jgi:hypothetical protein
MRLRVAALLACVVGLSGCARQTVLVDSSPVQSHPVAQTFDQHGIQFDYPGTWLVFDARAAASPGAPIGQPPAIQPQKQSEDVVGLDGELNNVSVVYGLSGLSSDDFAPWSEQIKQKLEASVAAQGVRLLAGPTEIRAAGLPALYYKLRVPSGLGYNLDVTWVGFPRGDTQFVVTCRSTSDHAAEIERGCQQILATLQIGGGGFS